MKSLREIGEFGLIEHITKKIRTDGSVICGAGDDAAVISYTKDKYLLFTTDMLIEGVHFTPPLGSGRAGFRRKEASFAQIGRKALAVNISDIAAMGGTPKYAVISAGFPKELSVRAIDEIMRGINTLAKEYGINIVGGDTVRARCIVLCVSLIGEVKKRNLTLRSGAKAGDLIFVTGSLGGSRRLKQFNFIPRVKEAQQIIEEFRPTALIDLSDGLASDLQRIAEQSRAGAVVFEELIPLSSGASLHSALYEGEDFELLFTMSLDSARRFYKKIAFGNNSGAIFSGWKTVLYFKIPYHKKGKFPITCIGKIVERKRGLTIINKKAKAAPLKQKGFRHF